MAHIRVRHPGTPPADVDLGPCHAQRTPFQAMRRTIDEAIVHAAHRPIDKPVHRPR